MRYHKTTIRELAVLDPFIEEYGADGEYSEELDEIDTLLEEALKGSNERE